MLITGTRILPDPYVGFFSLLAAYILLSRRAWPWAIVAGIAFGVAILFKYPALLTLPACLILAGRRRAPIFVGAIVVTVALLLVPLLPELHQFVTDTIAFQTGRNAQAAPSRVGSVILFLILLQPLAVFGLFVKPRPPLWILIGYAGGFAYVLSPQVYYHYMSPLVPYASILGAAYLTSLRIPKITLPSFLRTMPLTTAIGGTLLMLIWASVVYFGGSQPLHLTAAHLADVAPEDRYIDHVVPASQQILVDRPEVAYLAKRRDLRDYFWNDASVETAQQLFPALLKVRYVVRSFGSSSGYPQGFLNFIDARYCRHLLGSNQYGAFLYDLKCTIPYLPSRD